jgi:hypothetical protein
MDQLQLAMLVMAITDRSLGPRVNHDRDRQLTAEELDTLVEFGWHVPDLKGTLTACVQMLRSRWRPRASRRLDPTSVPSAATT